MIFLREAPAFSVTDSGTSGWTGISDSGLDAWANAYAAPAHISTDFNQPPLPPPPTGGVLPNGEKSQDKGPGPGRTPLSGKFTPGDVYNTARSQSRRGRYLESCIASGLD